MENQREKRRRIKSEAKKKMRQSNTSPYLTALIYGGVTVGAIGAGILCVVVPLVMVLGLSAYSVDNLNPFFWIGINGLTYIIQIVISFLSMFLSIGFSIYTLKVYRGGESRYKDLFLGFGKKGLKAFLAEFLIAFIICGVIFIIMFLTSVAVFTVIGLTDNDYIISAAILLMLIIVFIPVYILSYGFALSVYIIFDEDKIGITEAVFKSCKMMKGHKWELFVADLSFIGWIVLWVLSLGFAGIYVAPYYYTVHAGYYDEIKNEYYNTIEQNTV